MKKQYSAYEPAAIEPHWQQVWEVEGAFRAHEDSTQPKCYLLVEFPYPSGAGLHAGHVRSYTAMDAIARKRRREGYNVLYPMGWDSFGLPTENYAIKTGRPPQEITRENIETFRRQLKMLGLSFDWSREIDTSDPRYYRWTQWIFIQLFKRGLAYKARSWINWCPRCKIGLANEEVVNGSCERCGTEVEKREREQWMLRITAYAQRLYDDLDTVAYIEPAVRGQRHWIGPSRGARIPFTLEAGGRQWEVEVFTTRADTLYGATYLVLAPEHELVRTLEGEVTNREEVHAYVQRALRLREAERTAADRPKTGVRLEGIVARHPLTKEPLPVFVADYVLASYGTGAVMGVPAHDERDWAFAQQHSLPVRVTIVPPEYEHAVAEVSLPFTGEGVLVNAASFSGMKSEEAREAIVQAVGGTPTVAYRLRDWVFSRQRYWGEPIPMVWCQRCGWQPVPEEDLPVTLPPLERYEPTDTGDSPLAQLEEWVATTCPACGGSARRETDVMPNWAGSSWYYLRYTDPHNEYALASPDRLRYWLPVDWYNGGMEHTTLHLLYSRFWHKFLYDIGVVPTPEPYQRRTSHGIVLAADGTKMSKSKGNVVNPDDIVAEYGADTLRVYELFMGPFDQAVAWSTEGLVGVRRFLERVWRLIHTADATEDVSEATTALLHRTAAQVSRDIEAMKFNTAIARLMELSHHLQQFERPPRAAVQWLLSLLEPFAPHLAEEGWHRLGGTTLLAREPWPTWDEALAAGEEVTYAVQIDGVTRGTLTLPATSSEEEVRHAAQELPSVARRLQGRTVVRTIVVPGKVVNFVTQ